MFHRKTNVNINPHNHFSSIFKNNIATNSGVIDTKLFLIIASLFSFGLVMLFSSYYQFSIQNYANNNNLYYFVGRQFIWAVLSLIACVFFAKIKLDFLYSVTPAMWVITIILNLLPVFNLFGSIRGGSRWITVAGLSFQPSELAKLTVALYLSRVLYNTRHQFHDDWNTALKPAIMTILVCIPIYLQTDLSTTIFIFGMQIGIFYISKVPLRYLFAEIAVLFVLGIGAIKLIGFRLRRIMSWLNPDLDPLGIGWQAKMAKDAISEGGIFGTGLGEGTYKLGRISMASNDYIFAVIGEELGFIGMLFVIVLFALLFYRSLQLSSTFDRGYEKILIISLAMFISSQAFLNMAVVSGLFPVTGVPLPYFSAGGSSLLITMIMSGIMLNISKKAKYD